MYKVLLKGPWYIISMPMYELKMEKYILEKLDIHRKNNKVHSYLTPYVKITSKWTTTLHVILKTIKLLEKNRGNIYDIGVGNDFLNMIPKSQATIAKIDK